MAFLEPYLSLRSGGSARAPVIPYPLLTTGSESSHKVTIVKRLIKRRQCTVTLDRR